MIYSAKLFQPLLETLEELCGENTRCFMSSTDHGNMHEFLKLIDQSPKLKYKLVESEWLDEVFQADDIKVIDISIKQPM